MMSDWVSHFFLVWKILRVLFGLNWVFEVLGSAHLMHIRVSLNQFPLPISLAPWLTLVVETSLPQFISGRIIHSWSS